MAIARIEGGAIVEQRSNLEIADVPEHKRLSWLPIEGVAPSYDPEMETISGPVYQLEATRVLRVWTISPRVLAVTDYAQAIQAHVDSVAVAKEYANGVTLASYVASTIPTWAAEATTFIAWRDSVWSYAYSELAKVQAGTRTQPTISGLINELPTITW